MKTSKTILVFAAGVLLMSCEGPFDNKNDKTVDRGLDSKPLSELQAGVWIDPNGCDHWIIDDGIEGYLSQRLDRSGKPVCSGTDFSNHIIGNFKGGSPILDPI
ncbi:MAG: hypothetical protein V3U96_02320 [Paracoccaceae bacterium]